MTDWKVEAEKLARQGKSWRKIAEHLDQPKSTVSDHLRKVFSQDVVDHKHSSDVYSVRKVDQ